MISVHKMMQFFRHHWLLSSLIIAVIILRFTLLHVTPPGFYLDEAATGAHVISMLTHGTNAHGESWPLFSASLGGGYTTPIYLYPLTAWAHIFGVSEYALRAFSLTSTVAAAALLALGMRRWLGAKAALIGGLIALILPWGWVQSSIAWDTAIVPLFIAAAFYTVTIAFNSPSAKHRLISAALTGLCLIGLAYLYPPCRITAPLMLAGAYGTLLYQRKIALKWVIILIPAFALLCLPLLQFMLQPEALERSSKLSVFHDNGILEGLWEMGRNFVLILNPGFLFVAGDTNLRHATGPQGMLGLASLPAICALIYFGVMRMRHFVRTRRWDHTTKSNLVLLSIIGILLSILGSALTIEGQPHSLRATAAWPFFVILITIGWLQILQHTKRALQVAIIILAMLTTIWYVIDLAAYYPKRSADAFDVPIRQRLDVNQPTPGYPPLSLFYYKNK